MKKLSAVILAGALALSLMACGGSSSAPATTAAPAATTAAAAETKAAETTAAETTAAPAETKAEETAPAKPLKIGLSNFSTGNTYRVQMVESVRYRCEELQKEGIVDSCTILNCNGDANKQVSDIQDLIADGCDIILVTAATSTNCDAIIDEAREQGIIVASFNSQPSTEVDYAIIESEVEFGRAGGEWLVDKLGKEPGKKIVVLNGIEGDDVNDRRYEVPSKLFEENGYEILTTAYCTWDYSQAKVAMESILAAYPEIDGIYSQGGAMTLAAVEAFQEAGRELVPMTGESNNGLLKKWKELIDEGDENFDCICPIVNDQTALMALEGAIKIAQGEKVDPVLNLPVNIITKDNMDDYVEPDYPDSYWVGSILPEDVIKSLFSN